MTTASNPLVRLESLALIAIGGFVGANLRYLAGLVVPGLPSTLFVNALGSFLLGFVVYEGLYSGILAAETRTLLATGVLSSFTTYSTFALESAQAAPSVLLVNVVANYAFGFAGVLLGRTIAERLAGRWA